ncbi:MAG: hypothetical protein ABJZ55_00245 [Fuerstiella sp.]
MSTANLSTPTTRIAVPKEIPEQLQMLRGKSRGYAVLSGVLILIIAAIAVYWLTTGLDSAWFSLQKLELPRSFRIAVSSLLLIAAIWLTARYLVLPGFRRLSDTDMALLVERKFPEFQDRLITVVENEQQYPETGTHVESMLARTATQAQSILKTVSLQDVFDTRTLLKQGWIAGLLAATFLIHAFISPGAPTRWWNAFVECKDTYHVRTTHLQFSILADPGDRKIAFSELDGRPRYSHARGSDLQLLIEVPKRPSDEGQPWTVPDRVRIDVLRQDGTSSRSYVSKSSDSSFRFILTRLQEDISIEVLGGDYRTSTPLQIQAVASPALDQLSATCDYPSYTGWNQERGPDVAVLSSELALPMGTTFQLSASSSKQLQGVRIVTDDFEIEGDAISGRLTSRDENRMASRDLPALLTNDGLSFRVDFLMQSAETNQSIENSSAVSHPASTAVPLMSNTNLKFFLHDEDDIMTSTPESLRISGIPDQAPVIAVRQQGVTNAITRRAIIPMTGRISDDYGIATAGFRFLVDDESQWRKRTLRSGFRPGLEFELTESGDDREYFAVQPLDLTEGQTLAITVLATDGCDLPKANESQAEPMVFRIVSNEELLSLMYSQELALRRRFEEVIGKLEQIESDLIFHGDIAKRVDTGLNTDSNSATATQKSADVASLNRCAESAGNTLRRQKNELDAINKAFAEIAQQLINNAIPPKQLAENMVSQIIQPLQDVSDNDINTADRSVSQFRVAAGKGLPTKDLIPAAQRDVRTIINRLKTILDEVRDMAEFHEALSDLKNILEDQKRLMDDTRRQQLEF